jgi:hypothetical protein
MEHLSLILTSLFGLIGAWFVYNQKYKDKATEMKFEKLKTENIEKAAMLNRHIAIIHGEMWGLLQKLDADRCFIIQPHPEHKHIFLSVALEVDRKGVSTVKDIFQNVPISDIACFAKDAATSVWLYYDDVDKQVEDKKAKSMMSLSGSTQISIRQLVDTRGSWVGSLVVENIALREYNKQTFMEIITNSANTIQFILPPIY